MGDMADWVIDNGIENMWFTEDSLHLDEHNPPMCPLCGKTMVLRDGKYGKFWGCPAFPKCTGHRSAYKY